jgi:hypothetical protein
MLKIRHAALAGAAAIAVVTAIAPGAQAALLPFTFNPQFLGCLTCSNAVVADEYNLSSSELITQNVGSQSGTGYAQVTTVKFNSNTLNTTTTGVSTPNNPPIPSPPNTYGLYIKFTDTSTASSFTSPGTLTSFNFQLFADVGNNDTFTPANAAAGTGPTVTNDAGDLLLATGSLVSGDAGFNSNGGPVFALTSTFNLTATGALYYTAPVPFYTFEFTSATGAQPGNVTLGPAGCNPITFVGCTVAALTTTLDSSFLSVPVPEPTSLALLGGGLLGFAVIRRRYRKGQVAS